VTERRSVVVLVYEVVREWGFTELIGEVATLADAQEIYPNKIHLEEVVRGSENAVD
jgi:hypothetical protein